MKNTLYLILTISILWSCKNDTKSKGPLDLETKKTSLKEETVLQKVANNYGIKAWESVNEIQFSFVVNPGDDEFVRTWHWLPKEKKVTLFQKNDTITFHKNAISTESKNADKAFVNDSFWLLFPFHLVWDEVKYEVLENSTSPIHKEILTQINIYYPKEGGYTPGDTYKVYIDKNFNLKEWSYHPKGQEEPALSNTFEAQVVINNLKLDTEHANPETGFQLNFRDINIE